MERWRNAFKNEFPTNNLSTKDRSTLQDLLKNFKNKYPELMALEPEVGILQITMDAVGKACNQYHIVVGHKFVFDYRLMPEQFEG